MQEQLDVVQAYHEATKHHFQRYARGPGYLDWANQPDPFRRYAGAPLVPLEQVPPGDGPAYEAALSGLVPPHEANLHSISQLFFDSLAISAWKWAGDETWALRINPSSGNLHPTEGYLLCGPVPGLSDTPLVAHYAPREHALEVRARPPLATWQALTAGLPASRVPLAVGLSSIHWRESWKYGERAFRYCQLDVGHAVAALALAAAGLGWQVCLLDDLGSAQVAQLLGLTDPGTAEPEEPGGLLAVYPRDPAAAPQGQPPAALPEGAVAAFAGLSWQGVPKRLSPHHMDWPVLDRVAGATEKPTTPRFAFPQAARQGAANAGAPAALPQRPGPPLRPILHQRRSAVAMDGRGSISRDAFYTMMSRLVPRPGQVPFATLPWTPQVHLLLFVHRVEGLAPGLHFLMRDAAHEPALRAALSEEFTWQKPPGCPAELALYSLREGDAQALARQLSCRQAIASDGCFSLGLIAQFEQSLASYGPWFYRRLFWECGMVGQMLYLEAEAAGVRGTGIGCFFDDAVHELLGLGSRQFQSLYHFTVGHPVEDQRLTTLPAYPPPV